MFNMQTEWADRHGFISNDDRSAAPAPWIERYNKVDDATGIARALAASRLSLTWAE